jgi:hypothetical protein
VSQLLVAQRALTVPGWAKDALWRRAQAIPSLDLRFADNKSLVDAVTGSSLVTFTRASSGTFVGGNGVLQTATNGVPRFDHNPTTGESLGLLVEESRVNNFLYTEDFSNTWTQTAVTVTTNTVVAPDGTLTADTFGPVIGDGLTTTRFVRQSPALTTQGSYTLSVFVKIGTGLTQGISLVVADQTATNNFRCNFNLFTGGMSFGSANWATPTATLTLYPNGWYRCTVSGVTSTAHTSLRASIYLGTFGNIVDTYGTHHIWGAQLEAGAFPTSYIPTTTATVTRSADVATDTTRGGNIRSLFTQFRSPASGTRPVVSLDDNTANERIEILTSGTDPKLLVTDVGSAVADLNGGTVVANVTARAAARFSTDDYAISINGGTSQLDTSGTLPTVNRIRIGSNQADGYLNGTIARITGWDTVLPNLPPVTQ